MYKTLISLITTVVFLLSIPIPPAIASEKPEIFARLGHASSVESVAFSPDGRYALSGSGDNTLNVTEGRPSIIQ